MPTEVRQEKEYLNTQNLENPFYGKHHNEETKEKLEENVVGVSKRVLLLNNALKARTHINQVCQGYTFEFVD